MKNNERACPSRKGIRPTNTTYINKLKVGSSRSEGEHARIRHFPTTGQRHSTELWAALLR